MSVLGCRRWGLAQGRVGSSYEFLDWAAKLSGLPSCVLAEEQDQRLDRGRQALLPGRARWLFWVHGPAPPRSALIDHR